MKTKEVRAELRMDINQNRIILFGLLVQVSLRTFLHKPTNSPFSRSICVRFSVTCIPGLLSNNYGTRG